MYINEINSGLHLRRIEESENVFFSAGKSDYKIVKAKKHPKKEIDFVRELNDYVHLATGYYLDVIYDEILYYDTNHKYIVVGDTTITPDDIKANSIRDEKSGQDKYIIKTIGNLVFINGCSDEGTLFGVYDFLGILFDYDFYSENEYSLKKVTDLKMPKIDITEAPDFQYREGTYGNIVREETLLHRFRFNATKDMYVFEYACHNSFLVLPPSEYYKEHPEWYVLNHLGEPAQLCYSNDNMRAEYVKNVKKYLANKPNAVMLMGMEDNHCWCECEKCKASEKKYGKKSVSIIHFANKVVEEINGPREKAGLRPYKFLIFAYYATNDAPVVYDRDKELYVPMDDSVKFHKDLGVFYAPGGAQFTHSFDSDERNQHYYEELIKWQSLTSVIHLWTYPVFAFHHMVPYPFARFIQHNYKVYLKNHVISLLDQTQHEQCNYSTFAHLHAYLQSKLQWNVNLNQEELTCKFFNQYFKFAAEPMRQYFDKILEWYEKYIFIQPEARGNWGTNLMKEEFFPEKVLDEWKDVFRKAYKLVENNKDSIDYSRIKDRVRVEELSLDYMRLELYGNNWDGSELIKERRRFYEDFTTLGLQRVNEIERIKETVWKRWKIID